MTQKAKTPPLALMVLALCALSLSFACTYLKEAIGLGPVRPKVEVVEVAVGKASLAALELLVTIRVDNPNSFDLDFSKLSYKMVAAELEVANGTYDQPVSIPEKGRKHIKLPLTVDARNAMKLVSNLLTKEDEIIAVMTATADFDTPFGAMAVDFEDRRPLRKLAGF